MYLKAIKKYYKIRFWILKTMLSWKKAIKSFNQEYQNKLNSASLKNLIIYFLFECVVRFSKFMIKTVAHNLKNHHPD